MCGRFSCYSAPEVLTRAFGLARVDPRLRPRWNIPPGTEVPVVRLDAAGDRELVLLRWGLIPGWARDPTIGSRLVNARAETVAEKPAFRAAFRARRCLVVADGYFEWRPEGRGKQPYYLCPGEPGPFGMAALWEAWRDPAGQVVETCVVLTREAVGAAREVHDRMPVLVAGADCGSWLDASPASRTAAEALLTQAPALDLVARAVDRAVNDPRHDGPELLAAIPT